MHKLGLSLVFTLVIISTVKTRPRVFFLCGNETKIETKPKQKQNQNKTKNYLFLKLFLEKNTLKNLKYIRFN